jgi:hypothetical protein
VSERLLERLHDGWKSFFDAVLKNIALMFLLTFLSMIPGFIYGFKSNFVPPPQKQPPQQTFFKFTLNGNDNSNRTASKPENPLNAVTEFTDGLFELIGSALREIGALIDGVIHAGIWAFWSGVAFIVLMLFLRYLFPFIFVCLIALFIVIPFRLFIKLPLKIGYQLIVSTPDAIKRLWQFVKAVYEFFPNCVNWVTYKRGKIKDDRKQARLDKQFSLARKILAKEPVPIADGYEDSLAQPYLPEELKIYLGLKEPLMKSRKFLVLLRRRMKSTRYAHFLKELYS